MTGPVTGRSGSVACEPASDASGIANLKDERVDPDEEVHWGHARIEQRSDEGAVNVMNRLASRWVLAFTVLRWSGLEPYKQGDHEPVGSRQVLNSVLLG